MWGWLFLGLLLGIFFTLLVRRIAYGNRRPDHLTVAEYWVYVTEPRLPKTEDLMMRMVSENPHNKPGRAPIGAREGMLFTDLRLHMAAVLKSKNPQSFRPDLFSVTTVPSAEVLERLPDCPGFIKCRYMSESPLRDQRHLQFLPHLADSLADLCGGLVIYDPISEEILIKEEFTKRLAEGKNLENPLFHLRLLWQKAEDGWMAATKGLIKVGRPEWISAPQELDQEVLILGLFTKAAHQVFRKPETPWPMEFEEFGDKFILNFSGEWQQGKQVISVTRMRIA